jgi:hypothetical protein
MKLRLLILITAFCIIAGHSGAQSGAPYTEGPVWDSTMVKTKPGLDDEYLKSIAQTFKGRDRRIKETGHCHGLQSPDRRCG